jgi:glycine hydroxymethyltransferase
MLVDLRSVGIDGKHAERALDAVGITANRNAIPFDPLPPAVTSGIRLGSAAVTSRGFGVAEMRQLGSIIANVLHAPEDQGTLAEATRAVKSLTSRFPVPGISA